MFLIFSVYHLISTETQNIKRTVAPDALFWRMKWGSAGWSKHKVSLLHKLLFSIETLQLFLMFCYGRRRASNTELDQRYRFLKTALYCVWIFRMRNLFNFHLKLHLNFLLQQCHRKICHSTDYSVKEWILLWKLVCETGSESFWINRWDFSRRKSLQELYFVCHSFKLAF